MRIINAGCEDCAVGCKSIRGLNYLHSLKRNHYHNRPGKTPLQRHENGLVYSTRFLVSDHKRPQPLQASRTEFGARPLMVAH